MINNFNNNKDSLIKITDEFLEQIAEEVCIDIEKLPQNTVFCFCQFLSEYLYFDFMDLARLVVKIIFKCEEKNIRFEEKIPNGDTGLPWNVLRIKK